MQEDNKKKLMIGLRLVYLLISIAVLVIASSAVIGLSEVFMKLIGTLNLICGVIFLGEHITQLYKNKKL